MTAEESIKTLDMMLNEFCNENSWSQEYKDAVDVAVEALEKQIPKKIISKDDYADCPACGGIIHYWSDCYCHNCGQKYVWTEDE